MFYKRFLLTLVWCLSFSLQAQISVTPIIIDLMGQDADAEIIVKNFDTERNAYVEITPYQLMDPANPASLKKRVSQPEKEGLLVFPSKLILLPGQAQFVRIIKTVKELSTDKVYQIDFIPKLSTHFLSETFDKVTVGVKVIVGYGARVTLRPDTLAPSLSVKRHRNELIIENTGNTLLNITSCTQRDADNQQREIPLPFYSLFAGQKIKKELNELSQITLHASVMGKPIGPLYTD